VPDADPADPAAEAAGPPPAPAPLDVDGVGAITYGTIAWVVALIVCLVARDPLAAAGRTWWIWVCVAGAVLGLPGLWYVRRRRAAYRAAEAAAQG
jgi:hypothetical protein